MIPANVREAMKRIAIDKASGIASGLVFDGDFRLVATYAMPILERLLQTIEARQQEANEQIAASKLCVNGSMARAHVDYAGRLKDEVYTLQIVLEGGT